MLKYIPVMFGCKKEYETYLKKEVKMSKPLNVKDLYGKTAEDLLRMTNQERSIPVNLKKILEKFNISAISMDFEPMEKSSSDPNRKILGAIVCDDDKAAIFYNCNDEVNGHRYRFTIAHELAHCTVSKACNHIDFRLDPLLLDEKEIAANTFAGELLIPEGSLYETIGKLILPSIAVLSDIFEVSVNVMRERLRFLNVEEKISGYNC